MYLNDTIAAIATPVGEGGIGIIRISGPEVKKIARALLVRPSRCSYPELEDHRVYYGLAVDPETGATLDEVLFFYTQKPRSYTAEDTVEIQAHGGTLVLSKILAAVLRQGARMAEPGEFTLRAYLNGRIDLVQAESVIDLIRAKTDKAHQLALSQLSGTATRALQELETGLYQILIAIEAVLDFPEEGLPEPTQHVMLEQTGRLHQQLTAMLAEAATGRKIREGITVVIAGRPNVGKSSLLNKLLQEERAIVTEIPGTTRDLIEAQIQLYGVPVRLVDTAGLRPTDNPIEQIGIQKAEAEMAEADLILLVLDSSQPMNEVDREIIDKVRGKKVLLIFNKIDLPRRLEPQPLSEKNDFKILEISVASGEGFERVEQAIVEMVGLGELRVDDRPLLSRVRHKDALERSLTALDSFRTGLARGVSEDLLAVDLRSCLGALGEITGKNVTDEVVHGIFAQFCIGK
ncbi:MAG TPA: tRNA uridine-5-carboxymethylaminomethyl(34) synthesis GTPase MnmE [Bacillota bacterium]